MGEGMNRSMSHFGFMLVGLALIAMLNLFGDANAATLSKQRQQYLQARHALAAGNMARFESLTAELHNYPLYPYLRYEELRRRIHAAPEKDVRAFLDQFAYIPAARRIRKAWLDALMQRGQHIKFQRYYESQSNTAHDCFNLQARMLASNAPNALAEVKQHWLVGESQPEQCDPLFSWLQKRGLLTDELIWQRIDLAMEKGNEQLAKYLAAKLSTEQVHWFALWQRVYRSPHDWKKHKELHADHPIARKIVAHGIRRMARKDVIKAVDEWSRAKTAYSYTEAERTKVEASVALTAAIKHHPMAADLMYDLPKNIQDVGVQQWRARAAMRANDWPAVLRSIVLMDPLTKQELEWQYWRARALEEIGVHVKAGPIYARIAKQRDYYGFLAADRLQKPYAMNYRPLQFSDIEMASLLNFPPLIRARELNAVGQIYHARREWNQMVSGLSKRQIPIAAVIAHKWDWHHTAIMTVAKAKQFDDLELRFPQPFDNLVLANANKFSLRPEYVYGVMRQESAFNSAARSHAGASGLMQLMPATAKEVAQSLKKNAPSKAALLQPNVNVELGSKYLRLMLDEYGNQQVLATAAYNAGPHRVKRWLPNDKNMPADIWVDTIPFNETRKYVRRVMAYSTVYEWKMAQKTTRLQTRMPPVPAK